MSFISYSYSYTWTEASSSQHSAKSLSREIVHWSLPNILLGGVLLATYCTLTALILQEGV